MSVPSSPTLLVLAAGMGSRYGGLKQIDPVGPNGETILEYSIYDALRAGFTKVVFVIREAIAEQFRTAISSRFASRVSIEYVFQELDKLPAGFGVPADRTKPWGTTQAVLMAADAIHEPFAVINADDFYGAASYLVLAEHLQAAAPSQAPSYAMVGFELRNTLSDFGAVARGICQLDQNHNLEAVIEMTHIVREGQNIRAIDEKSGEQRKGTDLTGNELVSMNLWGFTPQVFAQMQAHFQRFLEQSSMDLKAECYLPNTVNALVQSRQAQVKVLSTPDAWFGVTYREDRPQVVANIQHLIQSGAYPERLWS
jgi:dTDP-glucose pyrophosphorylase